MVFLLLCGALTRAGGPQVEEVVSQGTVVGAPGSSPGFPSRGCHQAGP